MSTRAQRIAIRSEAMHAFKGCRQISIRVRLSRVGIPASRPDPLGSSRPLLRASLHCEIDSAGDSGDIYLWSD